MTRSLTASVTASAPAKINLHLGVGPLRGDGFHPLTTVYQAVDLRETVTATAAEAWEVHVTGETHVDLAGVPAAAEVEQNLAVRAGRALAAHHRVTAAARLDVHKRVPVAGGMAGGSADAAAALVALDRLWNLGSSQAALHEIAAGLGSDVPFALVGRSALGTGRGEVVEQIEDNGTWWWVVVLAEGGLSTPAVYRRFDELAPPPDAQAGISTEPWTPWNLLGALRDADLDLLARRLHNDLQAPALDLRPDLADVLAAGLEAGALAGLLSGSGPSCLLLCEGERAAYDVGERVRAGGRRALVTQGPAEGARVESE